MCFKRPSKLKWLESVKLDKWNTWLYADMNMKTLEYASKHVYSSSISVPNHLHIIGRKWLQALYYTLTAYHMLHLLVLGDICCKIQYIIFYTEQLNGVFSDSSNIFLWQEFIGINKIGLFPNFRWLQFCVYQLCMIMHITLLHRLIVDRHA